MTRTLNLQDVTRKVYNDKKSQFPVCSDKNYQETQTVHMQPVKKPARESNYMQSVQKTACHQIGSHPEITRNI